MPPASTLEIPKRQVAGRQCGSEGLGLDPHGVEVGDHARTHDVWPGQPARPGADALAAGAERWEHPPAQAVGVRYDYLTRQVEAGCDEKRHKGDGVGGSAPATAGDDVLALSRPGNEGSTGGLVGNSRRSRRPSGRLLDRLSLRRVVLRITRSRSCLRGVVGDEPVPIAYPIDAWRLNRPQTGLAPGPGGCQRGASGREVRTATTTSWIALLATAASASSSRSEAWVAFACRWRLLVDSVAMRSCFDCH